MIELAIGGGIVAAGSALGYLYYRGENETDEETDTWDREPEARELKFAEEVSLPADEDDPEEESVENVVDDVFEDEEEPGEFGDYFAEDEEEEDIVAEDVEDQADPLPEYVDEMEELTEISGIGPAKAETLQEWGYETPEDVFYANDDDLAELTGFGDYVVGQIRDDIGRLPEAEA